MKKALVVAALALVVLVLGGYLFRSELTMLLIAGAIAPDEDFESTPRPPAPDYGQPSAWAARPDVDDPSDARPAGAAPAPEPAPVKVFFVHPTTFMSASGWNQPLDDADANWIVDERVMRHQASVFNSCCGVYAPRYRQANFYAFLDADGDGDKALDLAYADVSNAFHAFLDEIGPGTPFILAGHSQGSAHATRLLREQIAGTSLERRLVAAYLVGFSVTEDQLGGVPVCTSAAATGCVVAWNTVEGNGPGLFPEMALICVNPLTWRQDGAPAGRALNLGAIGFESWGPTDAERRDPSLARDMTVEPAAADARCVNANLRVEDLHSSSFPARMPGNSLHMYDYSLFHMNIRANAEARTAAYLTTDAGREGR
jgi:hypothetical protein